MNSELFIIDLSACFNTGEIITSVSGAFEHPDARERKVGLKLSDIVLNQSQMLSIQSLIASYGSTLEFIETQNESTKNVCENMGIEVKTPQFSLNAPKEEVSFEIKAQEMHGNGTPQEMYGNGLPAESFGNGEPADMGGNNIEPQEFSANGLPADNFGNGMPEEFHGNGLPSDMGGNGVLNETFAREFSSKSHFDSNKEFGGNADFAPASEFAGNNDFGGNGEPAAPAEFSGNAISDANSNNGFEEFKIDLPQDDFENGEKQVMDTYKKASEDENLEETWEEVDYYAPATDEPVVIDSKQTIYVNQTLRSGQVLEFDGNVVIIGDCHPGSEIKAAGDITVWGVLGSIAHAGIKGNREAKIRALKMNAVQLRIADCYSRRPDGTNIPYIIKSAVFTPEEARIVDNSIVLFKLN